MGEPIFKRRINSGTQYLAYFEKLFDLLSPQYYFEIGVNLGKSIRTTSAGSVGVDPEFILRGDVVGKKPFLHLFQMTSDDFFDTYDLNTFLPGGFNIAFLDGMHKFEYLLRDFANSEKKARPDSIIILHDCLPINAEMCERERGRSPRKDLELKSYWTGDVWKVPRILQEYRPDLTINILDCAPTGLVLVSGLDPKSSTIPDNIDAIITKYHNLELTDETIDEYYSSLRIQSAEEFLSNLSSA